MKSVRYVRRPRRTSPWNNDQTPSKLDGVCTLRGGCELFHDELEVLYTSLGEIIYDPWHWDWWSHSPLTVLLNEVATCFHVGSVDEKCNNFYVMHFKIFWVPCWAMLRCNIILKSCDSMPLLEVMVRSTTRGLWRWWWQSEPLGQRFQGDALRPKKVFMSIAT